MFLGLFIIFHLFGPDNLIENGRQDLSMARDTLLPLIVVMDIKQTESNLYCDPRYN